MIKIYNEDCFVTMGKLEEKSIDIVLTSPFYNTNKKAGANRTLKNTKVKKEHYEYVRYDVFTDNLTNDEYCQFTVNLFNNFDRILKPNGCVLYNICYGTENTEGMFRAVNSILVDTNFTIADVICWKKSTAIPNSVSSNKLTRIWEFVFVFCREEETKTFHCNKKVTSLRDTGQKSYENIYNFIEAKNNDGSCPLNKATYSSDLCKQLLEIYAPENCVVYDPFMGSGTTAVACKEMGYDCYGSELSADQVKWANDRLAKINTIEILENEDNNVDVGVDSDGQITFV